MEKAIFYKEWIKTRLFWIFAMVVSICFVVYSLLRINRVIEFKGVGHLWEILLQKDTVFIDVLQYVPLIIGLIFGVVQFVPEVQQKRLKLTLHLPYARNKMILTMLAFGLMLLVSIFGVNYLMLGVYLDRVLAGELVERILLTALPWYLAGIMAYLFTAWICLEPTWKRRVIYALIALGVLRICFLLAVPQAYDYFLIILVLYTVSITGFSLLSVNRFREGRQD